MKTCFRPFVEASRLLVLVLALTGAPGLARAEDPFQWLEEIESPRSLDWVARQNVRTAGVLEADPRYAAFLGEARAIFTAPDRIAWPELRGGVVDNLWQDAGRVQGVWRTTNEAAYRAGRPEWTTLLDLDALSKAEGRNWIFKGAICLPPAATRCLVRLSDGGGDAVEIREFDVASRAFLKDGFGFPAFKLTVDWLDADTLVVARDWSAGDVTASGYPYVIRTVNRRGETREVFRGRASDVGASASVLRSEDGRSLGLVIDRAVEFFRSEFSLWRDGKLIRLPLPLQATYQGSAQGRMIFTIKEDWKGFRAGSVIALHRDDPGRAPELVFAPGPRQAVQDVRVTAGLVTINLLDEVKGAVEVFDMARGRWTSERLALPKDATFEIVAASETDDVLMVSAEGFLEPPSLWRVDAATGETTRIAALPPRFSADGASIAQYWATSSDGTRIPYFVVSPKGARRDGSTPTLMYGYGGFEIAKPPIYLPEMGRLWLERGGAYVIANIRGGGEFGPPWHQSVLREKRQLAFDDFAAVARDLTARGLTSPRRLGIYGRSNGGVLTTVSMTQHPELWNAVVVESPLVDMLRYHKLSAGASWVGEYGDPDNPTDAAFIARYSAYQNLKPGVAYPEAYITTNTRDDRVHPGHARKFAARLEALGVPYLYYEQTLGGHSNDSDPELNARRWARHYVYLAQRLMD
ncbi:MAG: S9 family peptidase [Phenylobacterium sp.]|nr:S9 family peptidase [Phenylobacterium sp.]